MARIIGFIVCCFVAMVAGLSYHPLMAADRHPLAGKPAPREMLIDRDAHASAYRSPSMKLSPVIFGTSGHRGQSVNGTFNEPHVAATAQAIADYRGQSRISGPLFMGQDTHFLSKLAHETALEVFAGNRVPTVIASRSNERPGFTATPVVSRAVIQYNRNRNSGVADGVLLTPSHNPPEDGGFKYNPPSGGPADTDVTRWIETRANDYLDANLEGVRRAARPHATGFVFQQDMVGPYVEALGDVIEMGLISGDVRNNGQLAADALGGASLDVWQRTADIYDFDLTVNNWRYDPTFSFMAVDHDGKIRMDCSSPHAMNGFLATANSFRLGVANDPDADRHGIVANGKLMPPNAYLAVAIDYLFRHRQGWKKGLGVGKTMVSSSMIDRVAADVEAPLIEVPVGFKWFVEGLSNGTIGFAGEESAGASFLAKDGTPWSTDKDGIILALLAMEMMSRTGRTPAELYADLEQRHGAVFYDRIDTDATMEQAAILKKLTAGSLKVDAVAGHPVRRILYAAPSNNAPLGGVKVITDRGWFAARPSGTEPKYKLYAESSHDPDHLIRIQDDARTILADVFRAGAN